MAYNAVTETVILFGGSGEGGALGDTWEWDGQTKTWTELFPAASPSPRALNSMAYDPTIGYIVLFGGIAGDKALDDTWIWSGSTWLQIQTPYQPGGRFSSAIAFDPYLNGLILFGGYLAGDVLTNQTCFFSLL